MALGRFAFGRMTVAAATLIMLSWIIGLILFAEQLPKTVPSVSVRTDAIVVLTGGSKRISTGVSLLSDGVADRLFISGVGAPLRAENLFSELNANTEILAAKVTFGSEAKDTPGNAIETAQWVAREKVRSIRLVTASYHMPRSLRELSRVMPDTQIVPHPVFPDQVKPDWWKYPGTTTLIAGEYSKYLFAGLRIWAADAFGLSMQRSDMSELK